MNKSSALRAVSVDSTGWGPSSHAAALFCAEFYTDQDLVDKILAAHKNIDTKFGLEQETLLHLSISRGYDVLSKLLIDAGANCNAINHAMYTPLILAAHHGRLKIVRKLLQHQVSVDAIDNNSESALIHAIKKGRIHITRLLLAHYSINGHDELFDRALMCAATCGQTRIAGILLEYGASCHTVNSFGWTPLHCSAMYGHASLVELLIISGADINAVTRNGKTVLQLAHDAALLKRGKDPDRLIKIIQDRLLTNTSGRKYPLQSDSNMSI